MKSDRRSALRVASRVTALASVLAVLCAAGATAQTKPPTQPDRAKVIAAAREIITPLLYCGLITIDEDGQPQARTMNPFPPDDDMRLEVVNYKQGLGADPETFRATSIPMSVK